MKPENWLKEGLQLFVDPNPPFLTLFNLVEFCLLHRRMLQQARPQYVNQIMEDNLTVVMRACREGCNIFVQYLIDYSRSMNINQQNERGFTALCFAVWNSKVECARILLSHPNIDVYVKCGELEKPVLWYCEDRPCFDLLLPYYPLLNEHEKNMAWVWGRYYHDEVGFDVKEMLKQFPRSTLRQMSDDLSSLLWLAAEKRDSETIKYLLSSYDDIIDINMQDKLFNGNTALREAILWNNEECIELLLDHPNLDLTLKDKKGKPVYDNAIIEEYKNQEQLFGRNSGRKVSSLLCRNKTVRWNRSKIMLVGQGRAGKTALANNLAGRWIGETESTIGAERMDMSLFYGRVKFNRLEEDAKPEQELETFIAELSYRESRRNHRVWKEPKLDTTSGWAKGITIFSPHQTKDQEDAPSPPRPALPSSVRQFEPLNEKEITPLAVSVKFMSRSGIYLVVFDMELFMSIDPTKHDCCCKELKFWLNSITMHTYDVNTGKTAPVALVGTRGDKIWRIQDHQTTGRNVW